jgi:hypothetical protein
MPIGRGRALLGNANAVLDKFVSGWQISTFSQFSSGEPNDMPANAIQLKDPRTPGGDWKGTPNWKDHQVRGWNPCVLRQFDDGRIVPQQFSIDRGCGTDPANYAWLMTAGY